MLKLAYRDKDTTPHKSFCLIKIIRYRMTDGGLTYGPDYQLCDVSELVAFVGIGLSHEIAILAKVI